MLSGLNSDEASTEDSNKYGVNSSFVQGIVLKSHRLKFYLVKAKLFKDLGEAILKRELVLNSTALKFDEAVYYYYCASMAYRAVSRWRDAGECLSTCAEINSRIKRFAEAAVFLTEASDAFVKVDKSESIKNLDAAVSIYCDTGRFDAAGRIEREIADINCSLQQWEEAAEHYQKAADFFLGDFHNARAYTCLVRQLHCLLEIQEYKYASDVCLQIAENCLQSNMRMYNYTYFLYYASLCRLAMSHDEHDEIGLGKYDALKDFINRFQYKYLLWINSKEYLFLMKVIQTVEDVHLDEFADHIYYWDNVRPLDKYQIEILKVVHQEIMRELAIINKVRAKELKKKEREDRRKAKIEKLRRARELRGLEASSVESEDVIVDEVPSDEEKSGDDEYDEGQIKTQEFSLKNNV